MKNKSSSKGVLYRCLLYCIAILLLVMIPLKSFSQSTGELQQDSLVKMGFENVGGTELPEKEFMWLKTVLTKFKRWVLERL